MLLFILMFVVFALAAQAQERPVKVGWDPPLPHDVGNVDGYNVYRVTITPALVPADYDVNLTTPLSSEYVMAYEKLNTELIPKGTFEFIIPAAYPGHQSVVRAYSATWNIESADSDILTLRPAPGKVQGLKSVALILESSTDLKNWAQRALYEVAVIAPMEVFRLRW